ncbi:MAG TPA: hypothetical protein VGD98_23055 [Ktedonobacteraceae bacterium]
MKPKWKWLPPWDMPSDPVKAVSWFLRWFLQVLIRYFYILIIAAGAYETYLNNGIVSLVVILLVGLAVWGLLVGLLVVLNFVSNVSTAFSEASRLSQNPFGSAGSFTTRERDEANVVEGSIITDLDEERRRRRQEM